MFDAERLYVSSFGGFFSGSGGDVKVVIKSADGQEPTGEPKKPKNFLADLYQNHKRQTVLVTVVGAAVAAALIVAIVFFLRFKHQEKLVFVHMVYL